jgi:DNA-binding transcriptional LysR family regulator
MSLNSDQLDGFAKLAQTGNFTKAAEKLHITQSALSQRIRNLEDALETTLLIRDPGGIRLTENGQNLLRYCQLRETVETDIVGHMKTQDRSQLAGTIRIAAFSSVVASVILPALRDLIVRHPQVRLQTTIREMRDLPALLKSGEADFLILNYALDQAEIEEVSLGEELNVLVAHRRENKTLKKKTRNEKRSGSTDSRRSTKNSETLPTALYYLDHDDDDLTTAHYFKLDKSLKSAQLPRHFLGNIDSIIAGVRLGLGQAVIPLHLIEDMPDIEILKPDLIYRVPVILHYYRQPYYTPLHQAVQKQLQEKCGTILKGSITR